MKKNILILLILSLYYSCESIGTDEVEQMNDFYALKVGNSWEYMYCLKDIDTNNFVSTSVTETVDITHTVELYNIKYYNFRHLITGNNGSYDLLPENSEKNFLLRDSLGYLIDQTGGIKYSNNNFEEHVVDQEDGVFIYLLKLSQGNYLITTTAGSFTCLDNHYFIRDTNGYISNSIDHIYRENGKGEILSTLSFSTQNNHFAERRLEFYSIQ